MTFELVRWGWPNTAAILALAMIPIMASLIDRPRAAAEAGIEPVTICQAECTVVAAAASPEIIFE